MSAMVGIDSLFLSKGNSVYHHRTVSVVISDRRTA
jgi:hypothetical protein